MTVPKWPISDTPKLKQTQPVLIYYVNVYACVWEGLDNTNTS